MFTVLIYISLFYRLCDGIATPLTLPPIQLPFQAGFQSLLKQQELFSQEQVNHFHIPSDLKHFFAGFSAGVGEWMFGHPFDTIKVRMMASIASKSPSASGEAARLSMRQSGKVVFIMIIIITIKLISYYTTAILLQLFS